MDCHTVLHKLTHMRLPLACPHLQAMQPLLDELYPELFPPRFVSEELAAAGGVAAGMYAAYKLLRIMPLGVSGVIAWAARVHVHERVQSAGGSCDRVYSWCVPKGQKSTHQDRKFSG
jgi:hypothetical protein